MASELLKYLTTLTLASSVAIVAAFMIRIVVRSLFGVAAAYATWLLVPVALVAVILPHGPDGGSILGITLEIDSGSALNHALGGSLPPSLGGASSITWSMCVVSAWAAGAALFAAYLAAAQRVFVNSLGRLSGSRRVLRAERAAGCPALLGVIHPKIVLPADFECRYTRLERLLIFSHERAHLRHGDACWNALVALLRCLFWFNPLVHLAAMRFRVDQELACDAAVMRERPGSQRCYASAMMKSELSESALPVGCHWQSVRHFKERLLMLKQKIPGRARRTCGLVCVTFSSVLVGYAAWAAEPILNVAQQTAGEPRRVPLALEGNKYIDCVRLTGNQEVPTVETDAWGAAEIGVRRDRTIIGTITTHGIQGTMAYIQQGWRGTNGPTIFTLRREARDTWVVPADAKFTQQQYVSFLQAKLYVTVDSAAHPDGEIRAQLAPGWTCKPSRTFPSAEILKHADLAPQVAKDIATWKTLLPIVVARVTR
jgi:beta-lactamase regulating signal transducer with metallopeptidase domain